MGYYSSQALGARKPLRFTKARLAARLTDKWELVYHGLASLQTNFFTAPICALNWSGFQSTPIDRPGYLRTVYITLVCWYAGLYCTVLHNVYMYFEWVPPKGGYWIVPSCSCMCSLPQRKHGTAFARVQIQYTLDIHDTTITLSDTPNQSNQLPSTSKENETSSSE